MSAYKKKLVQKFNQGSLLPANAIFEQTFRGSVGRYSFVAHEISMRNGSRKLKSIRTFLRDFITSTRKTALAVGIK